ncbi:unnamed protein product, partial [Dibothriocephalus latus]
MEAVATGSAGTSGERMPLLFKISTGSLFPSLANFCSRGEDFMLLGFGDSILPGVLCVFMAFYDACWKIRFPHHLVGAIVALKGPEFHVYQYFDELRSSRPHKNEFALS